MQHGVFVKRYVTLLFLTFLLFLKLFLKPSFAIDLKRVTEEISETLLYESHQWQALLHISNDRLWIDNPQFLLSYDDFSLERELILTLALLYEDPTAVCRFPARYQWLKENLSNLPSLTMEDCTELQTFLRNVPSDEIALVFASENLQSPSSMMGHVFLNIGGERNTGEHVEYSVSFFTDIDTWNIPRIFYESIVTGRPGYFALSPYQDQILRYLHEEQRNVWRYQLDMTASQRQIVQYHLFELRELPLTYYFHAYNCATLVNFVVAHAEPELLNSTRPWVTPLSVIRNSSKIIDNVSISPSTEWLIRANSSTLPRSLINVIKNDMNATGLAPHFNWLEPLKSREQAFLALETARAYNDFRFDERASELQEWQVIESKLDHIQETKFADFHLDLSQYKNPLKSPSERQAQIGFRRTQNKSYLQLSFLPASHRLDDDNRQYFGESGLQLGELSVLLNLPNGKWRVEHFNVYGMQNYLPNHPMVKSTSATIDIGYGQHFDKSLTRQGAWYAEGSLGRTWRLHPSIDFFTMLGAGAGLSSAEAYLYAIPRVGFFIRQSDLGKLQAEFSTHINQYDSGSYSELSFTQSMFINSRTTLVMNVEKRFAHHNSLTDLAFGLSYKYYF